MATKSGASFFFKEKQKKDGVEGTSKVQTNECAKKSAKSPPLTVNKIQHIEPYRYMFDPLEKRIEEYDKLLFVTGEKIKEAHGLSGEVEGFHLPQQVDILGIGRVYCASQFEVYLEDYRRGARPVRLDFRELQEACNLFSGQTVAVVGNNPNGSKLYCSSIKRSLGYCSGVEGEIEETYSCSAPFSAVVAYGPYSSSLPSLLHSVTLLSPKPNLLILCGPFVELTSPDDPSVDDVSFFDAFEDTVATLNQWSKETSGKIRILLVPSLYDAHHPFFVFPQPAFISQTNGGVERLSNPSTISVNGVCIGISNCDNLNDLINSSVQITKKKVEINPIEIAITHLLESESYYPVYPPVNVPVDSSQLHNVKIPCKPDILLFSDAGVKPFEMLIESVCCVAPGKVANGNFGHIVVTPDNAVPTVTLHSSLS